MSAALFDLDGTLIGGPSSERLFVLELAREGLLGPRQIAAAMNFHRRYFRSFGRHVLQKNKAYLAGLGIEDIAPLGRRFVYETLVLRLRPEVLSRLAAHHRAGEATVLLTGAPDFIARPLAAYLGMNGCVASRCASIGGLFTAEPPLLHPFGREKLRLAERYCDQIGVPLSRCSAYADSLYDLPLLEVAGRPVAVHPDAGLRRVARRRGWLIIDAEPTPLEAATQA